MGGGICAFGTFLVSIFICSSFQQQRLREAEVWASVQGISLSHSSFIPLINAWVLVTAGD